MKDFKSYKPESGNGVAGANGGKSGAQNAEQSVGGKGAATDGAGAQSTVNLAAEIARAFGGKSEGQIWQTILKQAEQGKRDGTLTNADLDNFYSAVAPLVDGFKRQKLRQIIAKLKAI